MEFINCGDQYCFECLERYVEYWIREGSWGLLPMELTCPVCGAEMLEDDWMPYISSRAVDLWHSFQNKRRENLRKLCIRRNCPICNHPQSILGIGSSNFQDFLVTATEIQNYLEALGIDWQCHFEIESVLDLMKESSRLTLTFDLADFIDSCQELFTDFLEFIDKLKNFYGIFRPDHKELLRLLIGFGRTFLRFISESIEDSEGEEEDFDTAEWKFILINLELNFQMTFPFGLCDICNLEFCLPCQRPDWFHTHHPETSSSTRPDGSKQCPRCFVAIEKEPDGCNEMRCSYCGLKFCWECGRKWSKECGIYKCKQQKGVELSEGDIPRSELGSEGRVFWRDPEIGVPNVRAIHRE